MTLRTPGGQALRSMLGEAPASLGKLVEAPAGPAGSGRGHCRSDSDGVMAPGWRAGRVGTALEQQNWSWTQGLRCRGLWLAEHGVSRTGQEPRMRDQEV